MRRASLVVLVVGGIALAGNTSASAADPLLAPTNVCANQTSAATSVARQTAAMRCLVRWARTQAGRRAGRPLTTLDRSARLKANAIVRCGTLSHSPCGTPWDGVFRTVGYRGPVAENLAAGSGRYATARSAMAMWLDSPGHRRALLDPAVRVFGVGLRVKVTVNGWRGSVWVLHVGHRRV